MARILIIATMLTAAPAFPVLPAQAAVAAQAQNQCADTPQKKARRSVFGSVLGSIGGAIAGQVGGTAGAVASVALPAASLLGDELLKMLDCKEQQQAAEATNEAIRGGVGSQATWQSETRPNVSGTSKVTAEQRLADGGHCLTVTDIVIVDGEETTVPKRMCRGRGASGYAKV
ncbi:MAG: hypothetical protein ACR2JJ_07465 [Sphingomicrobium sp.]